jgi:hypothetical protein
MTSPAQSIPNTNPAAIVDRAVAAAKNLVPADVIEKGKELAREKMGAIAKR